VSQTIAQASRVRPVGDRRRINVSAERVRVLADRWAAQWKRPPTNDELAGLIRQWVREEILFREAIDRGLDQGDELVRRRLIQRMNGIARGLAERSEPSHSDLRAFYLENLDRYTVPARRSFRHVYVSTERGSGPPDVRAAELLERLPETAPDEVARLGDPFVLAHDFALVTPQDVATRFGRPFADGLFEFAPGAWQGPLRSSFGLHLVEVTEAVEEYTPSFEEAQARVLVDVDDQRQLAAEAGLVAALASEYDIVYAWDDADIVATDVGEVTQVPDLDLLGSLAVLVPRRGGAGEAPRKLPVDEAGQPDWIQLMAEIHLTESHGEIALAGGAPARAVLIEPGDPAADFDDPGYEMVAAEFAKGLRATTGAPVVEGVSGWVGFTCDAEEMAVWMIRALAAENITVRREGSTVFLPVSVSFAIEDEIIDMVVAAARARHFFEDHIRVTDHEHE
jgi:hypothetical protein